MVLLRDKNFLQFAGKSETGKVSTQRPKTPELVKPKVLPRYSTPTGRPSISSSNKKNIKTATAINQKMNQSYPDKETQLNNFLATNLSESIGKDSNTKSKSRGISPSIRSKIIPSQIQGLLSNEKTPPNLNTQNGRSISASRGCTTKPGPTVSQEAIEKITRQSCSLIVTRGRKQESNDRINQKEKVQLENNRQQVLGSKMVDKFLNARMSNSEERQLNKTKIMSSSMNESSEERQNKSKINKSKINTSLNESSGFGRLMSKSLLDVDLKHMVCFLILS